MYSFFLLRIQQSLHPEIPATGIGLFRILYGLVTLQEIIFLLYFNHLIFDPIPYLDVEFPLIPFFLFLWGIVAIFLTLGYYCQYASLGNYLFWIVFVNFTSMQRDFDGGFDPFMIGAGFCLLFMPLDRAFSIDNLLFKLRSASFELLENLPRKTSILSYNIPLVICLGFLYFDSAIHKLFADHWLNGLGTWLPASMPYYISAIDWTPILNIKWLQQTIGYSILFFQFTFFGVFLNQHLRIIYMLFGVGLHLGILLCLNIYPFGMGMLIFYLFLVPPSWWQKLHNKVNSAKPLLTVFYDEQCPLCNRTVIIINHFDVCNTIDFKGLQSHHHEYPIISSINRDTLLNDLYAVNTNNQLYSGVNTYIQILIKMRYTYLLGIFFKTPGIYQIASKIYRKVADNRQRVICDKNCNLPHTTLSPLPSLYHQLFEIKASHRPKQFIRQFTKILIILILLQLNSSIHYGILYRLNIDTKSNAFFEQLSAASNSILLLSGTFLGITPHALYLHDHFAGYNDLLAITYLDHNGNEKWLPFVNSEGRMLAPNWGRVHSMWANIAVTPTIENIRLEKFIMKVTAFWGIKKGLDLNQTQFIIKHKKIESPTTWQPNLLKRNLSGEWKNIGTAKWNKQRIHINLPNPIK